MIVPKPNGNRVEIERTRSSYYVRSLQDHLNKESSRGKVSNMCLKRGSPYRHHSRPTFSLVWKVSMVPTTCVYLSPSVYCLLGSHPAVNPAVPCRASIVVERMIGLGRAGCWYLQQKSLLRDKFPVEVLTSLTLDGGGIAEKWARRRFFFSSFLFRFFTHKPSSLLTSQHASLHPPHLCCHQQAFGLCRSSVQAHPPR